MILSQRVSNGQNIGWWHYYIEGKNSTEFDTFMLHHAYSITDNAIFTARCLSTKLNVTVFPKLFKDEMGRRYYVTANNKNLYVLMQTTTAHMQYKDIRVIWFSKRLTITKDHVRHTTSYGEYSSKYAEKEEYENSKN